jgi:hypothetical protein
MGISRDGMNSSNDVHRVEKPKGLCVIGVCDKSNTSQSTCRITSMITGILPKPTYPEEVHKLRRRKGAVRLLVDDIGMEDTYHSCVPEGMGLATSSIITCMDNNVAMICPWINTILASLNIIGGEVDTNNLMAVEAMVNQEDGITLGASEFMFVSIVLVAQYASQKMFLESRIEILIVSVNMAAVW